MYGKERFTDIVTAPHVSKQQLTEQLFDLMSDKTWYKSYKIYDVWFNFEFCIVVIQIQTYLTHSGVSHG